MGNVSFIPQRMTWEEWHLSQIVQLHALLARDLGGGSLEALRASFNWQTVFAMTKNHLQPVEQHHAQELADGIAALAAEWPEFSKRQPPLDDVTEERKRDRERERQTYEDRRRTIEAEIDAVTIEDVWPTINKAWLRRRQNPREWRAIAATVRCLSAAR